MANPKAVIVTLRAGENTLYLKAVATKTGATSCVVTVDAAKVKTRGMTTAHADMDTAIAHLAVLAKGAEKLGWQRRAFGKSKPDAFFQLPSAPGVVLANGKKGKS